MVKIVTAGHRFYFIETQIIGISPFKRKNNIDKILTQLNDVSKSRPRAEGDHGFGGMQLYIVNKTKLIYQMIKQSQRVFAFPVKEIRKLFIPAGMYLIGIYKFPVT